MTSPLTPSRKQSGVAFWATVVVVGLLLYVLSIGPACWLDDHYPIMIGDEFLSNWIYWPVVWVRERTPQPLRGAIWWYIALWAECNPD
jgi:hypothetical protein